MIVVLLLVLSSNGAPQLRSTLFTLSHHLGILEENECELRSCEDCTKDGKCSVCTTFVADTDDPLLDDPLSGTNKLEVNEDGGSGVVFLCPFQDGKERCCESSDPLVMPREKNRNRSQKQKESDVVLD
eukprot:c1939_g1_i1.p1 GENE.c1939_g1_i1~~c1939_g1_i1.p1  ORF type:complete len:128 (+),score=31.28 c1939_g1_i1:44-427(+)